MIGEAGERSVWCDWKGSAVILGIVWDCSVAQTTDPEKVLQYWSFENDAIPAF